ncbi:MAG: hypothetical protein JWP65_889, partial [Ramlibacter sp.]|nr:hypothetical protein [Ramlibacter sp.]
ASPREGEPARRAPAVVAPTEPGVGQATGDAGDTSQ